MDFTSREFRAGCKNGNYDSLAGTECFLQIGMSVDGDCQTVLAGSIRASWTRVVIFIDEEVCKVYSSVWLDS